MDTVLGNTAQYFALASNFTLNAFKFGHVDDNTEFSMYLEFRIGNEMNEFDHLILSDKGQKNSGLNGNSNPELCNAGAVLHQLIA